MTLIRCFFFLLIFQFSAKAQWQSLGPTKVNGQEAFWYFHDPMEAFARKYETEIKGDSTFRHWEYYAKFRIGQGLFLLESLPEKGDTFLLISSIHRIKNYPLTEKTSMKPRCFFNKTQHTIGCLSLH